MWACQLWPVHGYMSRVWLYWVPLVCAECVPGCGGFCIQPCSCGMPFLMPHVLLAHVHTCTCLYVCDLCSPMPCGTLRAWLVGLQVPELEGWVPASSCSGLGIEFFKCGRMASQHHGSLCCKGCLLAGFLCPFPIKKQELFGTDYENESTRVHVFWKFKVSAS